MHAAAAVQPEPTPSQRLLEHCHLFDARNGRPSAAARLEALLGADFARILVAALCTARASG